MYVTVRMSNLFRGGVWRRQQPSNSLITDYLVPPPPWRHCFVAHFGEFSSLRLPHCLLTYYLLLIIITHYRLPTTTTTLKTVLSGAEMCVCGNVRRKNFSTNYTGGDTRASRWAWVCSVDISHQNQRRGHTSGTTELFLSAPRKSIHSCSSLKVCWLSHFSIWLDVTACIDCAVVNVSLFHTSLHPSWTLRQILLY